MDWIKIFNSKEEAFSILNLNSIRKITVQNKDFCLIRTSKGIFVTTNSCSHDGATLTLGKCTTNGAIECPWHHYLFDPESGTCINHDCGQLETFPVKIDETGVFFQV